MKLSKEKEDQIKEDCNRKGLINSWDVHLLLNEIYELRAEVAAEKHRGEISKDEWISMNDEWTNSIRNEDGSEFHRQ